MPRIDRRWLRATLWTAAALLVAVGGLAAWYMPRYVTPQPIDVVASFAVPGATEYVDPVTKQPADPSDPTATDIGETVWYSIAYTPDATVRIVTGIGNDGSHPVRVTAISLPCVPAPADEC